MKEVRVSFEEIWTLRVVVVMRGEKDREMNELVGLLNC